MSSTPTTRPAERPAARRRRTRAWPTRCGSRDARAGELDDDPSARVDDLAGAAQQGDRVAADADVAVGQQRGVPAALAGQLVVDVAQDRRATALARLPTASSTTSMPSATWPVRASAAVSRPGPQPMSRVGALAEASRAWSSASASSVHCDMGSTRGSGSRPTTAQGSPCEGLGEDDREASTLDGGLEVGLEVGRRSSGYRRSQVSARPRPGRRACRGASAGDLVGVGAVSTSSRSRCRRDGRAAGERGPPGCRRTSWAWTSRPRAGPRRRRRRGGRAPTSRRRRRRRARCRASSSGGGGVEQRRGVTWGVSMPTWTQRAVAGVEVGVGEALVEAVAALREDRPAGAGRRGASSARRTVVEVAGQREHAALGADGGRGRGERVEQRGGGDVGGGLVADGGGEPGLGEAGDRGLGHHEERARRARDAWSSSRQHLPEVAGGAQGALDRAGDLRAGALGAGVVGRRRAR